MTWLRRSASVNSDNGQPVESFATNGTLWARVSEDNGRRQADYSTGYQTGADVTIYVRNRPNLSALDRLSFDGRVYAIDSIQVNFLDDELICTAFRFDGGLP